MKKTEVLFKLNNIPGIRRALSGEVLERAALAGAEVIRNAAKINIRKTFSKRSRGGAGLAGSMFVKTVRKDATGVEVDVGPTKVYGRIQELGGTIVPVFAKLLSWIDPETGERRFAKKVTLPARPYLRPAVDENKNDIRQAISVQLQKGIDEACKDG